MGLDVAAYRYADVKPISGCGNDGSWRIETDIFRYTHCYGTI